MNENEVTAEWNGRRFFGRINEYGIVVITRPVPCDTETVAPTNESQD